MKIGFIFTEETDLTQVPTGGHFRSDFEIPDEAKSLPDLRERIIAIGEFVGQFTWAKLHLTCLEADLSDYLVKHEAVPRWIGETLADSLDTTNLVFNQGADASSTRSFVIFAPVEPPIYHLTGVYEPRPATPYEKAYWQRLIALTDQFLELLNTDTTSEKWLSGGFIPWAAREEVYARQRQQILERRAQNPKLD